MIRGMVGVVPNHTMETGRFYMAPAYRGEHWLFQCIQTSDRFEDSFRRKALLMTIAGKPELSLFDLPQDTPVVALDDVHVRIDPTSLSQNAFTTYLDRNMFLVLGDEAIICAPTDHVRGWQAVNITTGQTVVGNVGPNWLSFTRWSLVMDDEEGDELTIASFGGDAPPAD